ncbi:hypothetical protein BSKO_00574 [Bryopsis sp. KO-2023]|nr:hypothetical protein BSKO_00574 [Bryopsis sp. KO-2023]
MHGTQGNNTVGRGLCTSSWNSGRRCRWSTIAEKPHVSRGERVRLVKRERICRRPQEESIVARSRGSFDLHGEVERMESTTEAYTASRKKMLQGVGVAPFLLIVALLLLNAKVHSGTPSTFPTMSQTLVATLACIMSIMSPLRVGRLLEAFRIAKKIPQPPKRVDARKVMGAAFLVAGGTVGAGIVALPVRTASVGLLPSAAGLIAGWAYMLVVAFIIVDVREHCGPGANFTTMAAMTLGNRWKAVSGALYIFVYCATLTAYIAESATFIGPAIAFALGHALNPAALSLLFTVTFGGIIAMGSRTVDIINSGCVLVALAAFGVLVSLGSSGLAPASMMFCNWPGAVQTAPIMIVAFTFHNMIPSLFDHLKSAAAVRKALFIGTLIPLSMYLLWEVLILGSLPPGSSLASVGEVVQLMGGTGAVPVAINIFSLFAIITSFLGVGLGCIAFVQDLTGSSSKEEGEPASLWAVVATMVPPLIIACLAPKLFVAALEISGILRLILFAIIPGIMTRVIPGSGGRRQFMAGAVVAIAVGIIGICVVGRLAPVIV